MDDAAGNQILIFNEILLSMLTIVLFVFTNFVPSPAVRYQFGWIFIYLVYFMIILTMGIWAIDVYFMVKRQLKIFFYKRKLRQRQNRVKQHNKTIDIIGRHNRPETNYMYKRRNLALGE